MTANLIGVTSTIDSKDKYGYHCCFLRNIKVKKVRGKIMLNEGLVIKTGTSIGIKLLKIQVLYVIYGQRDISQADIVRKLSIEKYDKNNWFTKELVDELEQQGYIDIDRNESKKTSRLTPTGKDFLEKFSNL